MLAVRAAPRQYVRPRIVLPHFDPMVGSLLPASLREESPEMMYSMKMPGFTAQASLERTSNSYITHLTTTNSITDKVLPQMKYDPCLRMWRREYIGCRLDGFGIDDCTEYADTMYEAVGCPC
jgi:hypothetical protein